MFERAVCFTHGSPRSMFERRGDAQALRRSLRSLTHVRMQPLDVNHAHRCWLHRQHLFVEKQIYQIYLSFHVALLQLLRQHLYALLFETKCWGTKDSKESSLLPCCCCCCCLVAGAAAWLLLLLLLLLLGSCCCCLVAAAAAWKLLLLLLLLGSCSCCCCCCCCLVAGAAAC